MTPEQTSNIRRIMFLLEEIHEVKEEIQGHRILADSKEKRVEKLEQELKTLQEWKKKELE